MLVSRSQRSVFKGIYFSLVFAMTMPLMACSGGGNSGDVPSGENNPIDENPTPTVSYGISVSVDGLSGSGLVLQNNGTDDLSVTENGVHGFSAKIDSGASYEVTVSSQPVNPDQSCSVTSGSGTVADADITGITVSCVSAYLGLPPTVKSVSHRLLATSGTIVIQFSKSLSQASLVLSGSLAAQDHSVQWSTTSVTDDTITITPTSAWNINTGFTLGVDGTDSESPANAMSTAEFGFDVYDGTLYYVSNSAADDSGDGLSPANAKKTIMGAINTATAPATVLIAGGSYLVSSDFAVNTAITLKEGVSLYGGYSGDYSQRNLDQFAAVVTNESTVEGTSTIDWETTMFSSADITNATIVDGLAINGTTAVTAGYTAAYFSFSSSATLRNMELNAGNGNYTAGIVYTGTSAPVLQNSFIHGGAANITSKGIDITKASVQVEDSVIEGGTSSSTSYGIRLLMGSSVFKRNRISGGVAANTSYGIEHAGNLVGASTNATIVNNLISGGSANTTYGLNYENLSYPTIQHNTIHAGTAVTNANAIGLWQLLSAELDRFENNIVFATTGANTRCVLERNATADPGLISNNSFSGCAVVYYDLDAGCTGDADGDANSSTCTLAEMEALADISSGASANTTEAPVFVSQSGVDGKPETVADNDWRLAAGTPTAVTEGGSDLTATVPADFDGLDRTLSTSMGAFEYDAP